jgi:hypothetical protein
MLSRELLDLQRRDVSVFADHLILHLRVSKTDPFGKVTEVLLWRNDIPGLDPYVAGCQLLDSATNRVPSAPLLQNHLGSSYRRQDMVQFLALLGRSDLSGHSLRIGGATFLSECGFSDCTIRLLGRWESDCFKRYIRTGRRAKSQKAAQVAQAMRRLSLPAH